ncbi:MAG TPA: 4-hydroxy-tetrahydrodipicolinate reductase [Flavobacteriaceae bacterium]|nr:4-hydroxy-tetrahydrodipicolinate reductase [Flavobacteriaceae bacterium]
MKIALLGYGRMGKSIEKIALQKGHKIVYKTSEKIDSEELSKADVAIDFSVPEAAFQNIGTCLKNNVPIVSGTTGWLEKYNEAVQICKEENGAFLYASNFSIGVNLFFELNESLAKIMQNFPNYEVEIEETHHTNKLDAPSGTAISLAEQIIENSAKTNWKLLEETNHFENGEIPIAAKRIVDVPGTHLVKYASTIDDLEIKHTAHSREGFAAGAVMAAEWLKDKTGVFGMKDILKSLLLR